jgi:DNA-binding NarL/FixJ family response regulator
MLGLHLNLQAELASVYSVIAEIEANKGDRESCARAVEILREHTPIAFYGPDRFRLGAHAAQMLARCAFLDGAPAEALHIVQTALDDAPAGSAARFALRVDETLYQNVTAAPGRTAALAATSEEAMTVVPFDAVDVAKFAPAVVLLDLLRAVSSDDRGPTLPLTRTFSVYRGLIASRRDLMDLQRSAELLKSLVTGAPSEVDGHVAELVAAHERLSTLGFRFEAEALAATATSVGRRQPAVAAALRKMRPSQTDGQKAKRPPPVPRGIALTRREVQVLQLLERGLTNREIAQRLEVGTRTVDSHVEHVLAKFNAASRTRAVAEAIRAGVLPGVAAETGEDAATA